MICFITFVRLSFPYWLWRRVIPFTWFRLRTCGGCDLSAEDAYSSMVPNPTITLSGVCVALRLTLLDVISFNTLLASSIIRYFFWMFDTATISTVHNDNHHGLFQSWTKHVRTPDLLQQIRRSWQQVNHRRPQTKPRPYMRGYVKACFENFA
jgi:hypothetical protein